MNKHTPGPWRYSKAHKDVISMCGGIKKDVICDIGNEENAHLIAAAPDLLAALEDMLAGWKYIRESHGDIYGVGWDRAQDNAAAAIARARGES
jgi:hypothetical protein